MAKILFRVSGGKIPKKELGLGHVFRCINLANQLKSHEIHFLIEDYGSVKSLLSEYGFKKIFHLTPNLSESNDVKKTLEHISKNSIDLLIVDKYGLTNNFVKKMKKIVKTVVISDLKNISYDADLLVNGFIGFNNKIIFNKFKTKCLLGPKYQILSNKYENKHKYQKKYDLLITLGGVDANNLLTIILKKIIHCDIILKTKIILGPATVKTSMIKKLSMKHNHFDLVQTTKNMKKDISSAKFGICAGGLTTYEFAALNVPFGIVCQYKHQILTAKEWEKKKIAKNLGFIQINDKKLDTFLKHLIQDKIKNNSNKIIDGLGSKRIAQEILMLAKI